VKHAVAQDAETIETGDAEARQKAGSPKYEGERDQHLRETDEMIRVEKIRRENRAVSQGAPRHHGNAGAEAEHVSDQTKTNDDLFEKIESRTAGFENRPALGDEGIDSAADDDEGQEHRHTLEKRRRQHGMESLWWRTQIDDAAKPFDVRVGLYRNCEPHHDDKEKDKYDAPATPFRMHPLVLASSILRLGRHDGCGLKPRRRLPLRSR
jgi:hypothetical protein